MGQGLGGGTEGGGVGGGATENAHHVGQTDVGQGNQDDGKHGAQHDDAQTPQVECHAFLAQRTEKVGADMQAEAVDKHGEAEGLDEVKHRSVDAQMQVSCKNADEENEGDSQGDTADFELS